MSTLQPLRVWAIVPHPPAPRHGRGHYEKEGGTSAIRPRRYQRISLKGPGCANPAHQPIKARDVLPTLSLEEVTYSERVP